MILNINVSTERVYYVLFLIITTLYHFSCVYSKLHLYWHFRKSYPILNRKPSLFVYSNFYISQKIYLPNYIWSWGNDLKVSLVSTLIKFNKKTNTHITLQMIRNVSWFRQKAFEYIMSELPTIVKSVLLSSENWIFSFLILRW